MIKSKAKLIHTSYDFERYLNEFLATIDVRQIVKIEYSVTGGSRDTHSCIVFYVAFEDIRDAKLENILEVK